MDGAGIHRQQDVSASPVESLSDQDPLGEEMRANPVKQKLLRDETAMGLILLSTDPHVIGVAATAGFEYVLPDMEHTGATYRELEAVVHAADAAGIVPMARVAGPTKPDVLAVVETGVRGIMVPSVESADEARMVVEAARYGPIGRRGVYYMGYNSGYCATDPAEHFSSANRELLIILQIETVKGVKNAGEIADVPGVDCLFIGPGDLTQSLGVPWEFEHPAVWEAIRSTFKDTRLRGKIAGIMPAGVDYARRCEAEGARMMLWGPDLALFQRAAKEDAAKLAEALHWSPRHG
jgi:2-keto-3-deoxy-L-rhamnonate aldolase RhmA